MGSTTEPVLRCEVVSWGEVSRLASRLAGRIREAGCHPDIVVAIARGGYVPARLLCDHLNLYNLTSLRIAHYIGAKASGRAHLISSLGEDIRGKSVLLVDDVSDSGDTLQLAVEHIETLAPRELRVAVLHHKQGASLVPDFYGQRVIHWRWITYPWAVIEDLGGFLRRMSPVPTTIDEAAARLQQDYHIRVSRRILQDILAQPADL